MTKDIAIADEVPEAFQFRSRHPDPARRPQPAIFPKHHLAKDSVDIHPDHPSHLYSFRVDGRSGRHDTYGAALAAQPG
jgi:hypothetical protein